MTAAPAPRLYVPPVGCEVKVFWVVLEVVLVKEVSQLLTRCKLDPTWAVDVDVPAASLLAVFTLLEFPDPAVGEGGVTKLENFGQVGGPPPDLDIAVGGAQGALPAPRQ